MPTWSDILDVSVDERANPWGEEDLSSVLRHQLSSIIEGQAPRTFADALHAPRPDPRLLGQIEAWCDRMSAEGELAPVPGEVAEVLELLCMAARTRLCGRGTAIEPGMRTRFERAAELPWIDAISADVLRRWGEASGDISDEALMPESGSSVSSFKAIETNPRLAAPAAGDQRGRYVIRRPHAAGGLGVVSVATDLELHREVALKEIRPELRGDADSRRRFAREAQIAGQLEHPNILPVYALGCDGRGDPYYAMRFVGGRTLGTAIREYHAAPDAPRLRDLLRRFCDVCRAVAFAHSRGVIHRDLKPANVMLGDFGEAWIVDWGVAKRIEEQAEPTAPSLGETAPPPTMIGATEAGQRLGTPRYMSPEQASDASGVGPASDVYSLGAILREIVQPPRSPARRNVRPLLAVADRATARDLAGRYESAADLAAEVERWLADEPVLAHREGSLARLSRWSRRHRSAALAAVVFLLVCAVVLAVSNAVVRRALRLRQDALDQSRARLARALVLSADGMLAEARGTEAVATYREARRMLKGLGMSDLGAVSGLLDAYARSPRPLATFKFQPPPDAEQLYPRIPAAIAADGRTALLAGADGSAAVVDVLVGVERRRVGGHRGAVRCVEISRDGRIGVTGGDDGAVRHWDLATGRELHVFRAHAKAVRQLQLARDGAFALSAGDDHRVCLIDLNAGAIVREFGGRNPVGEHTEGLAISPDGHTIASGCHNGEVVLWDLATGAELRRFTGHTGCVSELTFSPDGRTVLCGSGGEMSVRAWDVATGEPALSFDGEGNTGVVVFRPDGKQIVAGGTDGVLRAWAFPSARALWDRSGPLSAIMRISPSGLDGGQTMLTADSDGHVVLWGVGDDPDLGRLAGHSAQVLSVAVSHDGLLVATASWDGTVRVWDAATCRELSRFGDGRGKFWSVAFGPDDASVFGGAADGTVTQWSLENGQALRSVRLHPGEVTGIALGPGGRTVLTSGGGDNAVREWELATGRLRTIGTHGQRVNAVCVAPDGRTVLSAGSDNIVRLWNLAAAKLVRSFEGHTGRAAAVAISPDGRLAVSGGRDQAVRLWDLHAEREVRTLAVHKVVDAVAFSPDGRTIATGGDDKVLRLWDVQTGEEVHGFLHHAGPIRSVAFFPDGSKVVSAGFDGTAVIYDLSRPAEYERFADELPRACERLRTNSQDGPGLLVLARWCAFRGADGLAVHLYRDAAAAGTPGRHLDLARALWRSGDTAAAAGELSAALERKEAPAAYLRLCLRAAEHKLPASE